MIAIAPYLSRRSFLHDPLLVDTLLWLGRVLVDPSTMAIRFATQVVGVGLWLGVLAEMGASALGSTGGGDGGGLGVSKVRGLMDLPCHLLVQLLLVPVDVGGVSTLLLSRVDESVELPDLDADVILLEFELLLDEGGRGQLELDLGLILRAQTQVGGGGGHRGDVV